MHHTLYIDYKHILSASSGKFINEMHLYEVLLAFSSGILYRRYHVLQCSHLSHHFCHVIGNVRIIRTPQRQLQIPIQTKLCLLLCTRVYLLAPV